MVGANNITVLEKFYVAIIEIIGVTIYSMTFGMLMFLKPILNREYEIMSNMVNDLKGVLGRKFAIMDNDLISDYCNQYCNTKEKQWNY